MLQLLLTLTATDLSAQADALYEKKDFAGAYAKYAESFECGDTPASYNAACTAALAGKRDDAYAWLNKAILHGQATPRAIKSDNDLASLRNDARWAGVVANATKQLLKTNEEAGVGRGLLRSTPAAEGVNEPALTMLVKEATDSGSSGLVVLRNGKLVADEFGPSEKTEAMSATKSIVSLAIGLLLDEKRIASLDVPVHTWFPEWRQGKKEKILLRHLLNHTSGLQADATTQEIYRAPDFVRLALAAELVSDPGESFFYNNKAVNLLPAIVESVSGKPIDEYLKERLFEPLGIRDFGWASDHAGNRQGMAGLALHPVDLAKIGQLLLDAGKWQGKQLVSERWIRTSTEEASQTLAPSCGLLWWRDIPVRMTFEKGTATKLENISASLARVMRSIEARPVREDEITKQLTPPDAAQFRDALRKVGVRPKITEDGDPFGFQANGYLGQYLYVMPKQKLVVVRMAAYREDIPTEKLGFPAFFPRARSLVGVH